MNKKPIHFSEEMQRLFQEQALLDISSGIHVLCEMEPLVPEHKFQSWQKQERQSLSQNFRENFAKAFNLEF